MGAIVARPSATRAQGPAAQRFGAEHRGPVHLTGEKFIYDSRTNTFVASGNAVLTSGPTTLHADRIELMRNERRAQARGHVHLIDPAAELFATRADIDLDRETADLIKAKLESTDKAYLLEGKRIIKHEGQNYAVTGGYFTTCACERGAPDWSISAAHIDVQLGDEGFARNASFNILDHPIFTLPYVLFPADTERHSGLLSPRIGTSGLRGFQYLQPYYIDISKSQDVTAAVDYESKQRIGGLLEYRLANGEDDYLKVTGAFYDESLRSEINRIDDIIDDQIADPHIPLDRYGLIGITREHITPDLTAFGDAVSVSDSLYLREMNVWTLSNGYGSNFGSMRNAPAHFGLIQDLANSFIRLQGVWNQDLIQPQEFALQQLPSLLWSGRQDLPGGFAYADYDFSATNFWRANGVDGLRVDLDPRVTVPWRLGDYVTGFGTVGMRETIYDVSGHEIAVTPVGSPGLSFNNGLALGPLQPNGGLSSRQLPWAKAGLSTELERIYDIHWGNIEKLKHTIEPFAEYDYVPVVDQGNFPLFDSVDRVEPRSLIIYGFTSRLFARFNNAPAEQDQEYAQGLGAMPASSSYYNNSTQELVEFTMLQAYDTDHAVAADGARSSDIAANLSLFPNRIFTLGSQVDYDPRRHQQLSFANIYFDFQPPWKTSTTHLYQGKSLVGSFVQLSYNYVAPGTAVETGTTTNASQFLSLRAYYDLFDRMGLYFAPSYDFASSRLLSAEYGIRIKSPCNCWSVDLGITKTINPSDTQYQIQATLGGIGSIGQMPFGRNPFEQMGLAGSAGGVIPRY